MPEHQGPPPPPTPTPAAILAADSHLIRTHPSGARPFSGHASYLPLPGNPESSLEGPPARSPGAGEMNDRLGRGLGSCGSVPSIHPSSVPWRRPPHEKEGGAAERTKRQG